MNKRIDKLFEQALEEFMAENKYATIIVPDPLKEKFAELIVRECMNIARNVGNISEPDDWALDRCYEIEQRIQDRFGVEE